MNWSSIKMVTTVSVCEQNKNDSLTDWHIKPSRGGGENQGENPEDEVKRPTPWGAQHARGHRGWFALMGILTISWFSTQVDVVKRLKLNKRRKRLPIIYHKITANKTYSTINLQMRVEFEIVETLSFHFFSGGKPFESPGDPGKARQHDACWRLPLRQGAARLSVWVRWDSQVVNDVGARDADWVDWFIGVDKVQNRTGDWFFGVAALRNDVS